MTADWYMFDSKFLKDTSARITNNVKGVNRVVYDITSKPPATVEWEQAHTIALYYYVT